MKKKKNKFFSNLNVRLSMEYVVMLEAITQGATSSEVIRRLIKEEYDKQK